jgi:hypothetical protein
MDLYLLFLENCLALDKVSEEEKKSEEERTNFPKVCERQRKRLKAKKTAKTRGILKRNLLR